MPGKLTTEEWTHQATAYKNHMQMESPVAGNPCTNRLATPLLPHRHAASHTRTLRDIPNGATGSGRTAKLYIYVVLQVPNRCRGIACEHSGGCADAALAAVRDADALPISIGIRRGCAELQCALLPDRSIQRTYTCRAPQGRMVRPPCLALPHQPSAPHPFPPTTTCMHCTSHPFPRWLCCIERIQRCKVKRSDPPIIIPPNTSCARAPTQRVAGDECCSQTVHPGGLWSWLSADVKPQRGYGIDLYISTHDYVYKK